MMSGARQYLGQLLQSLAARAGMTVFRLLRNALLARVLGPEARGLFALITTLPELLAAVGAGGLNSAVAYQVARHKAPSELLVSILVYGCLVCLMIAIMVATGLVSLAPSLEIVSQLGVWIWFVVLVLPVFVLKSALLTLHNAAGQINTFNKLRLVESALPLFAFLGLFLFWEKHGQEAAAASWLLGLILVIAISLRQLHLNGGITLRWSAGEQGAFLKYAARSHPDVLFQQLLLRFDYLLIGSMLGSEQLGYYAIATAAVELMLIVPEAVTTPLMKRLLRQGREVEMLVPMALRVTGSVMVLVSLLMVLFGQWLILLLFGSAYLAAYQPLVALLPGIVGLCYASILRLDLLGKNRGGILSLLAGLAAAINIGLNLLLIPSAGLLGAAWASSISYVGVAFLLLLIYRRLSGCPLARTLLVTPADIRLCLSVLRGGGK